MPQAPTPTTCAATHGTLSVRGYIVRRTFFDREVAHEDVATVYGACNYPDALELVREVRAEQRPAGRRGYAVIDSLYDCGCRGQG